MNILTLIQGRRTIRKYIRRKVSRRIIGKLIDAARWAPSPHNSQPWYFVVVLNEKIKYEFCALLRKGDGRLLTSANILLKKTADIIDGAPVVIFVYNTHDFLKRNENLGDLYANVSLLAEIQSIGAAIENICLLSTSFDLGVAWLNMPLLMTSDVNKILNMDGELVAVLALGYYEEKEMRRTRKPIKEIVKLM